MTGWKRLVLLLTLVVAVLVVTYPVGYFHMQSLREDRIEDQVERTKDQAATFRLLCERQEVDTRRLIDTKRQLIASDRRLRSLVAAVINPDRPPPSDRDLAQRFRGEVRKLNRSIERLRRGIKILRRELRQLDCANLPAGRPGKENQ